MGSNNSTLNLELSDLLQGQTSHVLAPLSRFQFGSQAPVVSDQPKYPNAHKHEHDWFDDDEYPDVDFLLGYAEGGGPVLEEFDASVE